MAKPSPDEIQEELDKLEDDNYGEETISGSNPDPDKVASKDMEEHVADVFGNEPEEEEPFDLADEIEDDEEAVREKPIDNYEDEPESGLEKIEKKEDDDHDDTSFE